jgi:succinyldiaminopimelate transaminase
LVSGRWVPPAYPYERLDGCRRLAEEAWGEVVDLSVGSPCDPAPEVVMEALLGKESRQGVSGYPPSRGSAAYREACAAWVGRRLSAEVRPEEVIACVGTKEFVASLPHLLRLRTPERDVVLYPELCYPTYEMGALLAGCRAVPVRVAGDFRIDLASIDEEDARRALLIWVNSPGNPAGQTEDLAEVVSWGRARDVLVASDECYAEFTWSGPPETALRHGTEGVLALHSLSKRSNLAGLRVGFVAGDRGLVDYLGLVRMHAGLMVPAPVQAAAVAAWSDDAHVDVQRQRYAHRLDRLAAIFSAAGYGAHVPAGGIYLWARCPDALEDSWDAAADLAVRAGVLVSPGDLYGPAGKGYVRVAAVQPEEMIEEVGLRLAGSPIR